MEFSEGSILHWSIDDGDLVGVGKKGMSERSKTSHMR